MSQNIANVASLQYGGCSANRIDQQLEPYAQLNYDKHNAPNSQDLPDVKALNFGFTLVRRESLIKNRNIIGDNPLFVTTTGIESIDIDTPLDFYIAEKIYRKVIVEGRDLLD